MTITGVPPRYDFRLENLRVFHLVVASCRAWGRKPIIANAALQQGRPNYTRWMDLECWLRRQKCGARGKRRAIWNFGRGIELLKNTGRRELHLTAGTRKASIPGRG